MLAAHPLVAFIATTDGARARAFYENIVGLRLMSDDHYAVVFDAHGTMLRIQRVKELTPHPFTALGWEVPDISVAVRELREKGVAFERYGFFEQDADDAWAAPDGTKVAWFKDPDGNTLSVTQFRTVTGRPPAI